MSHDDPVPDETTHQRAEGGSPEMVTLAEIARRVSLSKQRVSQLAKDDPAWPVPRDQWQQLGRYWLLPWEPVRKYFEERDAPAGLHRSRRKAAPEGPTE